MIPLDMLHHHCTFLSEEEVYVLMAIARKKDHEHITNSQEIVFREVIKRKEDIDRKYNKIKILCDNYKDSNDKKYNFYIYVSVNPRDIEKAFFLLQKQMIGWAQEMTKEIDKSRQLKKIDGMWISTLMKSKARRGCFMIDVDVDNTEKCLEVIRIIEGKPKLKEGGKVGREYFTQRTRNGYHMVCSPFDRRLLEGIKDVEVKTDGQLFVEYVDNRSI